jgi:hypothetical protein
VADPRLVTCDECDGLADVQACFVMCPTCTKKDSDDTRALRAALAEAQRERDDASHNRDYWNRKYDDAIVAINEITVVLDACPRCGCRYQHPDLVALRERVAELERALRSLVIGVQELQEAWPRLATDDIPQLGELCGFATLPIAEKALSGEGGSRD